MADLIYDTFLEIAQGLPTQDILAMCQTRREWRGFCQRPDFWDQVIRRSLGIITQNATPQDYTFLRKLYNQDEVVDAQRISAEETINFWIQNLPIGPTRDQEIARLRQQERKIIQTSEQVVANLQEAEFQAWRRGDPIVYWAINPTTQPYHQVVHGIFFPARTVEGAILQLNKAIPEHDIIVQGIVQSEDLDNPQVDEVMEELLHYYTDITDPNHPYFLSFPQVQIYQDQ